MQTSTCLLDSENLERGVQLSRKFKQRSKSETNELYQLIQSAALEAQDPQNASAEDSLKFVVLVFEPLIKKIATKIYPQVSRHQEFEDILQETYVTFLGLVYAYNPLIASFPYYINKMLVQQVRAWGQKTSRKWAPPVDIVAADNLLSNHSVNNQDKAYETYHSYILMQEYEEFILARAEKPAKSGTVKAVCYDYFLGRKTCMQIAKSRGISYHAVYEVIKRIERDLKEFLQKDSFLGISEEELS